jgi:hypothetical protein
MFQVGELVRAQRSVQAMVEGRVYRVTARFDRVTFVGTFCTYDLEAVGSSRGDVVSVGNAHLLVSRVAS